MDKGRTIFFYKRLGGEVKDSFDMDYSFISQSIIDELLLVSNRTEISEKYHPIVDELIAYSMRISDLDIVIRQSSSSSTSQTEGGKVKSITVGDTKTEFSEGVSAAVESATVEGVNLGSKYINLKSNLISKIRRLRC